MTNPFTFCHTHTLSKIYNQYLGKRLSVLYGDPPITHKDYNDFNIIIHCNGRHSSLLGAYVDCKESQFHTIGIHRLCVYNKMCVG